MTPSNREDVCFIYDAVASPGQWHEVLQRVVDKSGMAGCIVYDVDRAETEPRYRVVGTSTSLNEENVQRYLDEYRDVAIEDHRRFHQHALSGDPVDVIEDDVIAADPELLKQRPNVKYMMSRGLFHRASVLLNKDNHNRSCVALSRAVGVGRLLPEERAYLHQVLPHVAKAMDLGQVTRQLGQAHGQLLAAMDQLSIGVCLLDAQARIVHANEEFQRQLDRHNAIQRTREGRLYFVRSDDQRRFVDLLADAMAHGQFGARPRKEAIEMSPTDVLCIELAPLRHLDELGSGVFEGAILYSTDTSRAVVCDPTPMGRIFDLTNAELEIVALVTEGLSNPQIADVRGRSRSTVDTQMKTILSKTGCSTRTQLVRLAMTFGADFVTGGLDKAGHLPPTAAG